MTRNISETIDRAMSLAERLTGCVPVNDPAERMLRDGRLGTWRRLAAKGDNTAFTQRLSWLHKTQDDVAPLLGRVQRADACATPAWADFMAALFDQLHAQPDTLPGSTAVCDAIPFAHVLLPIVEYADHALDHAAGEALASFAPNARADVRRNLLTRLSRLAAPVLYQQFSARERSYSTFVSELRDGGLEQLLREYSVLCRLLGLTALSWIQTTTELARRVAADAVTVGREMNEGVDPGAVVSIDAGLSDPHDGGRTVVALTFECGLNVIYKPRSLSAEVLFGNFIAFLNATGDTPMLKVPRVIDCGDHGWEECIRAEPCRDTDEVATWYARGGALLALVTAVGGLDLHYENIIACGAWPVPIDLETVFQPRVARGEPPAGVPRRANAGWLFQSSVLRTGLIPIWQPGADGAVFDCGGLTGTGAEPTRFQTPRWSHVNTDEMSLEYSAASTPARDNLPMLDGQPQSAETHVDDVLDGFTRMYRALMSHGRELVTLLEATDSAQVRFLVRPSNVYDAILRQSLAPEALRDGADRSIRIEMLARGMLVTDTTLRELLPAEIAALEHLDIPCFRTSIDDTSMGADGCTSAHCFEVSARSMMTQGLEGLDEHDLLLQRALIRTSFGLRFPDIATGERRETLRSSPTDTRDMRDARANTVDVARSIAHEIASLAISTPDGATTWFRIEPLSNAGEGRIREMTPGLYAGTAGVALFLSSFARVAGDARARALALSALRPLQDTDALATHTRERGIGLAEGIAGIVYALAHCGNELADERLIDFAETAADTITQELIDKDRHFDVLYGAAGAALALLALYRSRPSDELLERARWCGRHLVAQRVVTQMGARAWRTLGACLTGVSHGSAGITLALSRLYEATGETMFLDAALEAVEYEDSQFVPAAGNWSDLRAENSAPGTHHHGESWCHGAPGIVLARLCGINAVPETMGRHVTEALRTVQSFGIERPDSLCCGNFGIVDSLLTAGLSLGIQDVIDAAHARSAEVLQRAARAGFRSSIHAAPGTIDSTLFQGTAGIGYVLLRLAFPSELPSILMFDGGEPVSLPEPGRVACGKILSTT